MQFVGEATRRGGPPADGTSDLFPQPESQRRSLFRQSIDNLGGRTVFAFKFAQFLAILGLLGISSTQLALQNQDIASRDFFGSTQIVQVVQCVLYVSGSRSMNMMMTQ